MPDGIRWVGLDVHARESTLAIFDQASGEVTTKRVMGRPHELLSWLRAVERPARMVYEAGPTGYGLARRALAEGIELAVCAPSKTERPSDRVKTDQRDAIRLARLLAAGELVLVTIPSVEREQLRDLVRCREDIRVDLVRARHRIGKLPAAPRDLLGGHRRGVDAQAPLLADLDPVRRSCLALDTGRLPARP